MPQLHLYLPEELAARVREQARARGKSVSRYLAELVVREVGAVWPHRYFEEVVGRWRGEPVERPPRGEYEARDEL